MVIPTFNHAEYLRVALQSVLNQTCQDFEVIVVNNYSSDHTLDVIREIGDSRIRVINFRNEGVIGASRNEGIKESLGRYVAFLDSDDRWRENKLERVAQVFEEGPGLGLVCHDLSLVREGQEVARTRFGPPPSYRGTLYDHLLFSFNGPATSASVVVKHRLEEVIKRNFIFTGQRRGRRVQQFPGGPYQILLHQRRAERTGTVSAAGSRNHLALMAEQIFRHVPAAIDFADIGGKHRLQVLGRCIRVPQMKLHGMSLAKHLPDCERTLPRVGSDDRANQKVAQVRVLLELVHYDTQEQRMAGKLPVFLPGISLERRLDDGTEEFDREYRTLFPAAS